MYRVQSPKADRHSQRKASIIIILVILVLVVAVGAGGLAMVRAHRKAAPPASKSTTLGHTLVSETPSFNKRKLSVNDPTSLWIVVNKPRALQPVNYVPTDLVTPDVPLRVPGNESMQLRKSAATALKQMFTAAKQNNLNLMISSAYRSYNYQVNLYNGYVRGLGQVEADKTSARPGHSEHQTGLAVDVEPTSRTCEVEACFATTPQGIWVAANAYKYGFIIRYTADKVDVTGYEYEPWHLRYVGTDLAGEMRRQGIATLEEFFDLPGGKQY